MRVLTLGLATAFACASSSGGSTGASGVSASSAGETECGTPGNYDAGCAADEPGVGTDGATDSVMQTWGAPCTCNEDCVALLGEGAVCDFIAVIYELPGGTCTKPCVLPDTMTTVVRDDPACDPAGGVDCVGQAPIFQRCAARCSDDAQCDRVGFYCRQMPTISKPEDPSYCLMPDCCQIDPEVGDEGCNK